MTLAVLDTTVIIHLSRKNQAATNWLASQGDTFAITPIIRSIIGLVNGKPPHHHIHQV